MHMGSTYKTVFKTSPIKCALEVLVITFASCKQSEIPPFGFQSHSFRERWRPVHPKTPCAPLRRSGTGVQPHSKFPIHSGDWAKSVLPSAHYSHRHSRPCHMGAYKLSTHALAVPRTANSLSRHHMHVFAGGNFSHSEFWASIISAIQGNFSHVR